MPGASPGSNRPSGTHGAVSAFGMEVAWGFWEVAGRPGLVEGAFEEALLASACVGSSFGC